MIAHPKWLCYTCPVEPGEFWYVRPGGVARVNVINASARAGNRDAGSGRAPLRRGGRDMGKYKQWLHHQEIGRRLRDQINTLEQERARVQKMAPAHPTALPELENPIIAALLNYTRAGNKLSDIDVIKAAMPKLDADPDQRRPAGSAAPTAAMPAPAPIARAAQAGDSAVVASLLARAQQMPSDPLDQLRELSGAGTKPESPAAPGPAAPAPKAPAAKAQSPQADSVGGWWQRQRADDKD
jgi:hypothetical protein